MASWNNEFCLSCDRQIAEGGIYCSQRCRLADLEKAGAAAHMSSSASSSSSSTSSASSSNGFYLPPAVNFASYRSPASAPASRAHDSGPASPPYGQYYPTASSIYYNPPQPARPSPKRSLTPSSSRSSLASSSSQPQSGVSQQAASQLNNYMRSFDQVRDWKRRYTQY